LTTTVNNIEHIESSSYNGIGIIKVFFRQGTSVDAGVAQVTAISQTVLRALPPGNHAAADHPIQKRLHGSHPTIWCEQSGDVEQEVFDTSVNRFGPA